MMKPPLTVLLGAGASAHANVPMTAELTNIIASHELGGDIKDSQCFVRDPQLKVPITIPFWPEQLDITTGNASTDRVYGTILSGLAKDFTAPNFEQILAVLENLHSIVQSQQQRSMVDKYRNVLAPFVKLNVEEQVLTVPTFLWYSRRALIELVFQTIQERLQSVDHPELHTKSLFDFLRQHFKLSIFNLNYDDLIERCHLPLCDGFEVRQDNITLFDQQQFQERLQAGDEVLCHLHGSIRFGYGRKVFRDLVRYDTVDDAFDSLKAISVSDTNVNGALVTGAPLISGLDKMSKLNYSSAPYRDYYRAFEQKLALNSRLLIIGYGGCDPHINTLLDAFIEQHKARKVVYVTARSGAEVAQPSESISLMQGFAKPVDVFHSHNAYYDETYRPEELSEHGKLLLSAAGFPFKDAETTNKIVEFLS